VLPHGSVDEPIAFDLAWDGRVYLVERKGALKVKYPHEAEARTIARLSVNTTYQEGSGRRESQEGLLGIALDPGFERTGWVYLLYAAVDAPEHRVVRLEVRSDQLVPGTERIVLRYPVDRDVCCHFGGGMGWDRAGNLYIAVGSNTGEALIRGEFQFTASDERPGRASWDAQRTAANTNDLRGKILRIHPEADGSYTIPPGNLFPPGQPNTRPEIFTMGHRNPWHPTVDAETGWLHWGEVGPDRRSATAATPAGFDELNLAKGPGFFGWPYFVGDNTPYAIADLVNNRFGVARDPRRPLNDSINNTGLRELPPAQPALIAYSAESAPSWPALGSGGGCAMGGPIYRRSLVDSTSTRVWPERYEGKWIVTDCARRWILAVGVDRTGAPRSVEPLGVDYRPTIPVDMKVDRQGDLYVLEYGSSMLGRAADARLMRIEYRAGNRNPVAVARSDREAGRAPLKVRLSGDSSWDPDREALRYRWVLQAPDGRVAGRFDTANALTTLTAPGIYRATLTVTDRTGGSATSAVPIAVGNEPPSIGLTVRSPSTSNATFLLPGNPLEYALHIHDFEDGAVVTPVPEAMAVSIDVIGEDEDVSRLVTVREDTVTPLTRFRVAQELMNIRSCAYCHAHTGSSRGPTLAQLSERYHPDDATIQRLVTRVRQGGGNVWGTDSMPMYSRLSPQTLATIVSYMVSGSQLPPPLPLQGTYTPPATAGDGRGGLTVIRAVYTDRGDKGIRPPRLVPSRADIKVNTSVSGDSVVAGGASHIAFETIDLTDVAGFRLSALALSLGDADLSEAARRIEIRLDSPTGRLIGQAVVAATSSAVEAPARSPGESVQSSPGGEAERPLDVMKKPAAGPQQLSSPPPPVDVAVAPVTGRHTLFFVFTGNPHTRLIVGTIGVSLNKPGRQ
jgi:cytochrome c